jgi:hypothetical protein
LGTADEDEDYGYEIELSSQFGSLPRAETANGVDLSTDGSIEDMTSKTFMKALQQKLDTLKASEDMSAMAKTMQQALKASRLSVTDVVAGDLVSARDVANGGTVPGKIAKVTTSERSSFLRDNLLRDSYGRYVRNDDGDHIDKAIGASAYFGRIGNTRYYLR